MGSERTCEMNEARKVSSVHEPPLSQSAGELQLFDGRVVLHRSKCPDPSVLTHLLAEQCKFFPSRPEVSHHLIYQGPPKHVKEKLQLKDLARLSWQTQPIGLHTVLRKWQRLKSFKAFWFISISSYRDQIMLCLQQALPNLRC